MIRVRVEAGAPNLIQDLIDQAASISPIANWKGYYNSSGVGSKDWRVWLQRFDASSDELCIVETSGMGAPPKGSPYKAIQIPTLTGFSIGFTPIGSKSYQIQTGNGYGGGSEGRSGAVSVPLVHFRIPANSTDNLGDFVKIMNAMLPAGGAYKKFFYNSAVGNKAWEIYAITDTIRDATTGSPAVIILISMGGMAITPIGSEFEAVPIPTEYPDPDAGTITLAQAGFVPLQGPLQAFPA